MKLKDRIIYFKILMFLCAFLFGITLWDFEFNVIRVSISLTFLLVSIGSYYEWYVLSKENKA